MDDTCPTGKVQHRSGAEAARHMRAVLNKAQRGLNIYKCGHCGDWHVGRRPKPIKYVSKEEPCTTTT